MKRLLLVLACGAAMVLLAGVWFWRYIESHRPQATAAPAAGFAVPGTQHLLGGLMFRDCGFAPSPDGTALITAVRRRDTSGDGKITHADLKTLLLIDAAGETTVLCEAQLVWQDKPVRWSPGGKRVALAMSGLQPGWTSYDPTDIVVYDPVAHRELARYPHGINPLWLHDGRLAFQRDNAICVAQGDTVAVL
ncbi:MAG TPA: hypothetical protein PKM88_12665, partial [bacterium]|nr:hypothetical protein [bacterium]